MTVPKSVIFTSTGARTPGSQMRLYESSEPVMDQRFGIIMPSTSSSANSSLIAAQAGTRYQLVGPHCSPNLVRRKGTAHERFAVGLNLK